LTCGAIQLNSPKAVFIANEEIMKNATLVIVPSILLAAQINLNAQVYSGNIVG
jgi:hypothetical protein